MTVNFTKGKFNLREKLKELERPSVDKLVTKDADGKAYIDTISGNTKLENIDSVISDTAVDIFIYDTSKDSDGGAWRKRTTHTSWYNETLGTATRGTRREFPSVAVLVLTSTELTIYDGDDPDLPMWMVFTLANNYIIRAPGASCFAILNAKLVVGDNTNYSGSTIDFIMDGKDATRDLRQVGWGGNIADRNTDKQTTFGSTLLVGTYAKDVAMTVLPNAPIDPATGLPIPIIAVGTNNGLTVISENGNPYDVTGFAPVQQTGFSGDKLFIHTMNGVTTYAAIGRRELTADIALNSWEYGDQFNYSTTPWANWLPPSHTKAIVTPTNEIVFGGGSSGLFKLQTDDQVETNGDSSHLDCEITTSYNTGWMHGDIKGAFLSDTDATNVTSDVGLITGSDSTFDDVIANLNWSERSGSGGAWNVSGGVLKTGTVSSGEYLDITTSGYTSGQTYVISYTLSNVTGSMPLRWRFNNGQMGNLPTSNGFNSYSVTLTETGTLFSLLNDANLTADIDNFKLQLVQEEDRSVNNKGLAVYGTITKSAVATGAELVAYSGFNGNNSNYLEQPYNSDLDFGTGDCSIMYWFYQSTNSNYQDVLSRQLSSAANGGWTFQHQTSGVIRFYVRSGGGYNTVLTSDNSITTSSWTHVAVVRTGNNFNMYINGVIGDGSGGTETGTMTLSNANLRISTRLDQTAYPILTGNSIALVRLSASAPSAEQIKKIYEDEKVLFQENAKCTLYGSSDAVTALAYDEVTEQLHVGTSSGRSDFQGLRRINNTTTAVTTAISAHDEFIVEQ